MNDVLKRGSRIRTPLAIRSRKLVLVDPTCAAIIFEHSETEKVHVGEELSDVLLYLIRLVPVHLRRIAWNGVFQVGRLLFNRDGGGGCGGGGGGDCTVG